MYGPFSLDYSTQPFNIDFKKKSFLKQNIIQTWNTCIIESDYIIFFINLLGSMIWGRAVNETSNLEDSHSHFRISRVFENEGSDWVQEFLAAGLPASSGRQYYSCRSRSRSRSCR